VGGVVPGSEGGVSRSEGGGSPSAHLDERGAAGSMGGGWGGGGVHAARTADANSAVGAVRDRDEAPPPPPPCDAAQDASSGVSICTFILGKQGN
jgi:hypothetical protein